jgi:hypothetical protein
MPFSLLHGFLRSQSPPPSISVASGGTLAAGSIWLGIVRQNRVGFDRATALQQITVAVNQKIQISLPANLAVAGEDLHRIWAIAASSNNLSQATPLACWRAKLLQQIGSTGYFSEVENSLPATLELSSPNHVALGAVVANPSALTALTGLLDGMQRYVTSLAKFFYYDALSVATVNGSTVISAGAAVVVSRKLLPWVDHRLHGIAWGDSRCTGLAGCGRGDSATPLPDG